jgi:hypothetical protein
MKTPGLIIIKQCNRICLKHPDPSSTIGDEEHGNMEDLYDLCEDHDRRDFLLKCIFTDENNPLREWHDLITYNILNEKFPSILHHFGECTSDFCAMSRSVDPTARSAVEEIYVKRIIEYLKGKDSLDIVIYGIGRFLTELLILTRVVRQLRLKNIRLHVVNLTMGELYGHLEHGQVDIDDIVDKSDPATGNQKTNYFRVQYAKLCAISEWFSGTGYTNCEIYIYKDFLDMASYSYDVFMGIDFVEEFTSPTTMAHVKYVSMKTSKLILLAHEDHNMTNTYIYHYTKVAVIKADKQTPQRILEITRTVDDKQKQIKDIEEKIRSTEQRYRGFIPECSKLSGIFSATKYIKLLTRNESDDSILSRLSENKDVEIIDPPDQFILGSDSHDIIVINPELKWEKDQAICDFANYINDRFIELDIQIYNPSNLYYNVLMTKTFGGAVKMIGWTFLEVFMITFIGFTRFFKDLVGTCTKTNMVPDTIIIQDTELDDMENDIDEEGDNMGDDMRPPVDLDDMDEEGDNMGNDID